MSLVSIELNFNIKSFGNEFCCFMQNISKLAVRKVFLIIMPYYLFIHIILHGNFKKVAKKMVER